MKHLSWHPTEYSITLPEDSTIVNRLRRWYYILIIMYRQIFPLNVSRETCWHPYPCATLLLTGWPMMTGNFSERRCAMYSAHNEGSTTGDDPQYICGLAHYFRRLIRRATCYSSATP